MKKALVILLALALALSLFGCGNQTQPAQQGTDTPAAADTPASEAEPAAEEEPPAAEEWHFTVNIDLSEEEYTTDDGTVFATSSYEQPVLQLENAEGEVFDGSVPERGVTPEQFDACAVFNEATTTSGLWDYDIEAEGLDFYNRRGEADEGMPNVYDELTVSSINLTGDLVSVMASASVYLGGAHPSNGLCAWNFDVQKREFVDLLDLTDRSDELVTAIIYEISSQVNSLDYSEGFYENWFETLSAMDDFDVYFGEDAMTVFFQEYVLGSHAVGVQSFNIPYDLISRYLNDYGKQLLNLPVETTVIGDFREAQELWGWLEAGAPAAYGESIEKNDNYYYRVNDSRISTLEDLGKLLSKYVEKSFVDAELAQTDMFLEIDGVLYTAAAGRGDDLTIGYVDYDAQLDASGESGKVVATIHRQDFDDETSDWVLTGATDVMDFPFVLSGGHAVFSTMEYIY